MVIVENDVMDLLIGKFCQDTRYNSIKVGNKSVCKYVLVLDVSLKKEGPDADISAGNIFRNVRS